MVTIHAMTDGSDQERSRVRVPTRITTRIAWGLAGLVGLLAVSTSYAQLHSKKSSANPGSSPDSVAAPKALANDDTRRFLALERTIGDLSRKGQYTEALAPAKEVLAIRTESQGPDHWETGDARRRVENLKQISLMGPKLRAPLTAADQIAAQGDDLFARGEYLKAREVREQASEQFRLLLGGDQEWTARSEEKLAYNLYRLDLPALAEPLFRKTRSTLLRILGENHPDFARIEHELGYCLDALKQHDEAGRHLKRACEIWEKTRGEDHPDTANGYDGLANHLKELGKHPEAEPLYRKALEIDRRALGEENPQTASGYFNLAFNLLVRGKSVEAEPLFRKALEIRLKVYGENHPDTAMSYSGVAWALAALNRTDEVECLHAKALKVRIQVLGENHRDTAESYQGLARTIENLGRYEEAEPLYRKALEIRSKVLGKESLDTAYSYDGLVRVLDQLGRVAESEPLHRKSLGIRLKLLGEDHPDIAASYQILGNELYLQGKFAEAELVYHRALEIRRRRLGVGHHLTAEIYNDLAANLWSQGKTAEAEPLLRKVLEIRAGTLGKTHPGTANSYQNLGFILSAQGKYVEAEMLYRKALAMPRQSGELHAETATIYDNLAHDLYSQGKFTEAEALYQKAISIWVGTLGEYHPDTASGYRNMAANLDAQGKYAEAEPFYRKALATYRRVLGEDHPDTAFCLNNLASNLHARGKTIEAEAMVLAATKSFEVARSRVSFTGIDRVEFAAKRSPLALAAALQVRRGNKEIAWQYWEAGLARGLFDDLAARRGRPLTNQERTEQEDLCGVLNRLDNQISILASTKTLAVDQQDFLDKLKSERLKRQGDLARFESELVRKYQLAQGSAYSIEKIQSRLANDEALVGWLDLKSMPNPADPRGEHWACVLRRTGPPRWIRIKGTAPGEAWTQSDDRQPDSVRRLLGSPTEYAWQTPLSELAAQRLAPLESMLGAGNNLPAVRHLIVLPSPGLSGIPIEALLLGRPFDTTRYLVSYVPSATLFAWLQEGRQAKQVKTIQSRRLLALGDPIPPPSVSPNSPRTKPPNHGLLVERVEPNSIAQQAGIKDGDILIRYKGVDLSTQDDLERLLRGGDPKTAGVVSIWRRGNIVDRTIGSALSGVQFSKETTAEAILARIEADAMIQATRGEAFIPLPGTRREVQEIAALFNQSMVLLGSDANEQALARIRERGELASFDFIHLASHAEMDDLCPMNSRLLLSQEQSGESAASLLNDGPAFDSILSASEVMSTWKLKAELVTLSACRSGLGRQSGGEGYLGFSQALFLAGARSVVLSLWNVDDTATAMLMKRFYENVLGRRSDRKNPMTKAEALAEAKEWLRSLSLADVDRLGASLPPVERIGKVAGPARSKAKTTRPYEHPYYWAAFVLIGDPN